MFSDRYFVCAFMHVKYPNGMAIDSFDLVRKWFQAFNAGDVEALTALYHDDATNDSGGMAGPREGP